ncbi:nitrite reductase [Providencia rettgeri]|nr:nitrite reductase [Providencia rettgeri]
MTTASAFHFESLVWDWPIAVYLFLIGISAGLVVFAVLMRQYYPTSAGSDSTLMRTTLILAPTTIILGLLILILHLTRPWTFWKLMFHYSPTSVMSMGVMLFQVYMAVLVIWLAKIYEKELIVLQQKWLPKFTIIPRVLTLLTRAMRFLDIIMLVLAVLLGAYTGFLLSALKSYPFLNNPLLPALFLFSGISSGIAVSLIALALRYRKNIHNAESAFLHRIESFVIWLEIFLLAAFFVGLALGDDGKIRSLIAALGGGFWTWWFWIGVVGFGFIIPLVLKKWMDKRQGAARILLVSGASLLGVFCLRFFVLYAGQLTVA